MYIYLYIIKKKKKKKKKKKRKLKLYPNGYNETLKDFVSIYLSSVDAQNNDTIHIYAKSIFYIRNNNDYACLKSFGGKYINFFFK